MSNNATKTEMLVEMKLAYKVDNVGEGRSLRSRTVNYTINEKNSNKKENKIMLRGAMRDKDGERELSENML